jgi:hypothetical protein
MEIKKLNHASPEVLEQQRIAAIKALSYQERLERLFELIRVSYLMKTAPKQEKNARTGN